MRERERKRRKSIEIKEQRNKGDEIEYYGEVTNKGDEIEIDRI